VLAIPPKRCDRATVCFLTANEIDALLAAPDRTTWLGRRDYALLLLACQTGLRVSELTTLTRSDVHLGVGVPVRQVMRVWLAEHDGQPSSPLFPTSADRPLSRDAVERLVRKHAAHTAGSCPTIAAKNVTPHTLRYSAAMARLHAGVDTSVIALWMGHQDPGSTQSYLHVTWGSRNKPSPESNPAAPAPADTGFRHPARWHRRTPDLPVAIQRAPAVSAWSAWRPGSFNEWCVC
jgi:site-specific recombinase XerD